MFDDTVNVTAPKHSCNVTVLSEGHLIEIGTKVDASIMKLEQQNGILCVTCQKGMKKSNIFPHYMHVMDQLLPPASAK